MTMETHPWVLWAPSWGSEHCCGTLVLLLVGWLRPLQRYSSSSATESTPTEQILLLSSQNITAVRALQLRLHISHGLLQSPVKLRNCELNNGLEKAAITYLLSGCCFFCSRHGSLTLGLWNLPINSSFKWSRGYSSKEC